MTHYILVRCPVCSGSGAIQCEKGSANPCIMPLLSEERCDCCDGRGGATKEQTDSLFCAAREARRR